LITSTCRAATAGLWFGTFLAILSACSGALAAADTVFRPPARRADALKVLLVTGGHDHDVAFYSAFDGHDDLAVMVDGHPSAFAGPFGKTGRRVEVLALYDMPPDVPEAQRENVRRYVEDGGAVVAIHHAIAGSTGWVWLHEEVLGARWNFAPEPGRPVSDYKHDEEIAVKVVADHPITKGLMNFRIYDETYGKLWMSPRLQVLLRTDHPLSDGPVAWTLPHPKARLAVIQLGHGREAHMNPSWRRLVRNALVWAGGRD
jgi:type 1 glutamine amidotransferase